jgi:hypothetical protein
VNDLEREALKLCLEALRSGHFELDKACDCVRCRAVRVAEEALKQDRQDSPPPRPCERALCDCCGHTVDQCACNASCWDDLP